MHVCFVPAPCISAAPVIRPPCLVCWSGNVSVSMSGIAAAYKPVQLWLRLFSSFFSSFWMRLTYSTEFTVLRDKGGEQEEIKTYSCEQQRISVQTAAGLQSFLWRPRESLLDQCNDGARVDRCLAVWAHQRAVLAYTCIAWEARSVGLPIPSPFTSCSGLAGTHDVWCLSFLLSEYGSLCTHDVWCLSFLLSEYGSLCTHDVWCLSFLLSEYESLCTHDVWCLSFLLRE